MNEPSEANAGITPHALRRRILHSGRVGWQGAILAAAFFAGVFQLGVVARDYMGPLLGMTWEMRALPAWHRAALVQEGEAFAGLVSFLRDEIPEGARVVLPPTRPERPVAHIGFMQYFLFPRDIHNCGYNEVDDCILRVVGPNTYVIGLPDFPPRELALRSKRFIQFQDDYGVFAPR
jgi:hypothetical protein